MFCRYNLSALFLPFEQNIEMSLHGIGDNYGEILVMSQTGVTLVMFQLLNQKLLILVDNAQSAQLSTAVYTILSIIW